MTAPQLTAHTQPTAKGDAESAPNNVLRLYREGITPGVILEAAEATAPIFGHSTILMATR